MGAGSRVVHSSNSRFLVSMSIDLLIEAAVASTGSSASLDSAKEARLKVQCSLVFLDGKKLGPLRTLESATFESCDAQLVWPGGTSVLIRFADSSNLDTLKSIIDAAQKRPSKFAIVSANEPH